MFLKMAKSELYLEFNAKIGDKTVAIPAVKIADGVISTSELINNTLNNANTALGEDAFNASSKTLTKLTSCSLSNKLIFVQAN